MRDGLGRVQSVLVVGGTSDIGVAVAGRLVERGATTVVLAGRDPDGLARQAAHLRALGATTVGTVPFDALDRAGHAGAVAAAFDGYGDVDVVVHAVGVLGDQEHHERDPPAAATVVDVNFTAAVTVLLPVADRLLAQGHGTIVVLSSVAAERARRANYVYGSSKAGLDAFATGLGDRLAGSGVRVLVVRPGFVHTAMTAGREPAPMSSTPGAVADAVVRALERGEEEVWVPARLRLVMTVLRHLPRPVFRRLRR